MDALTAYLRIIRDLLGQKDRNAELDLKNYSEFLSLGHSEADFGDFVAYCRFSRYLCSLLGDLKAKQAYAVAVYDYLHKRYSNEICDRLVLTAAGIKESSLSKKALLTSGREMPKLHLSAEELSQLQTEMATEYAILAICAAVSGQRR